jgi:hypothetical protein
MTLVALAAIVTNCGGSTRGRPLVEGAAGAEPAPVTVVVDEMAFCRAQQELRCRRAQACCGFLGEALDTSVCESFLEWGCTASLTDGVDFDAAAAARCVDARRAATVDGSCENPRPDSAAGRAMLEGCSHVYVPTRTKGQGCSGNESCVASEGRLGYCSASHTDGGPASGCEEWPPTARGKSCYDRPCAAGLTCVGQPRTCGNLGAPGVHCDRSAECASGNCRGSGSGTICDAEALPALAVQECHELSVVQKHELAAIPLDQGRLAGLTTDANFVYWSAGLSIWRTSKAGQVEAELVYGTPGGGYAWSGLTVVDDAIYALEPGAMLRIGNVDGSVSTRSFIPPEGLAVKWAFSSSAIWVASDCRTLSKYSRSFEPLATVSDPDEVLPRSALELVVDPGGRVFCATGSSLQLFDPARGSLLPVPLPPETRIVALGLEGARVWLVARASPDAETLLYVVEPATEAVMPAGTISAPPGVVTVFDPVRRRFYWQSSQDLMFASLPDLTPSRLVEDVRLGSPLAFDETSLYFFVANRSLVKFPVP